jgi:hypothetical protein
MLTVNRNRGPGSDVARKAGLAAAATLMAAVMTACGGGGDGGGSASTPASPSGAAPTSSGEKAPLAGVASAKGATTLSWTPPTMNEDGSPLKLTGYRIYWGLTADNLTNSVTLDNPGLTRYVIEQLKPATWYFVATALSSDGESEPSNVIAMQVQ